MREGERSVTSQPEEIAPGVYRLAVFGSNVYFVQSGPAWALIDAGWAFSGPAIHDAAASLFGADARPAAMLLTHNHPDHAGAALELARQWEAPIYVGPPDVARAGEEIAAFQRRISIPLDHWLIFPLMRLLPPRIVAASRAQEVAFRDVARALDPKAGVSSLPDWQVIPTPGHSPGHTAFFRPGDGVLLSGDALLTVNYNSLWDLLRGRRRVSGPPYISTWNWRAAKRSVATLARLQPRILASGHGAPMAGPRVAQEVRAFAERFVAVPAARRPVGLSRSDRLALFIEHQLDTRLEAFGVFLFRLTRGQIARRVRAPGDVLALTTRGRRTGKRRTVLLLGFRDGDDMVIVAANTGEPRHPGWYYNLKANPLARMELNGGALNVRAEELTPEEAAAFWPRIIQQAPTYARYPQRTTRVIPLMRLIPAARGGKAPAPSDAAPQAEKAGV
jgi:deazaflavin-dependent oxidoreductase (nitroreductase family)